MEQIIIHSKFITDYPEVAQTYYFLRGISVNHCGWVNINLRVGAVFLSRSKQTIKKRLKKGLQLGVFQEVRQLDKQGNYFVKLKAFKKIEEELLGYSFSACKIDFAELRSVKLLKQRAYEAAIFSQQQRTEGAIDKKHKKIFDPCKASTARNKQIAAKRSVSKTVVGFPNYGRGNNFFVNSNTQSYGASQMSVGHELNRSRKTVSKHISQLERVNIYRRVNEPAKAHYTFIDLNKQKEVYYERLPNCYLPIELDVRCRGTNPDKRLTSYKAKESADQKERDIDYILSLKKPARRTLEALLVDFSEIKIKTLAAEILWFFKGVDASEKVNAMNPIDLMLAIVHSTEDGSLTEGQIQFVGWLARVIDKGRYIRHSLTWQQLSGISDS